MQGALIGPWWNAMVNSYPSPGLGRLAAITEREGHEAAVLDIGLRPASRFRPQLGLPNPPVDFLADRDGKRVVRDDACPNLWYHTHISCEGRTAKRNRDFNPADSSATRADRTAIKAGERRSRPARFFDRMTAA